jgi:hypothetical protein
MPERPTLRNVVHSFACSSCGLDQGIGHRTEMQPQRRGNSIPRRGGDGAGPPGDRRLNDGLQTLAQAHALVAQYEECWWEAEVHRLRGVLLLRLPGTPQAEAETWLQRAVHVARRQGAKSLELRAAVSLTRLWRQQGKCTEARQMLEPIYGWFTKGFDTAGLQHAQALHAVRGGTGTGEPHKML